MFDVCQCYCKLCVIPLSSLLRVRCETCVKQEEILVESRKYLPSSLACNGADAMPAASGAIYLSSMCQSCY